MRHFLLALVVPSLLADIALSWRPPFGPPLGLRVRALRAERGLTQEALAVRAGLSVGYIHKLEHGSQRPSVRTLRKLAAALGVDLLDLVGPVAGPPGSRTQENDT